MLNEELKIIFNKKKHNPSQDKMLKKNNENSKI